MTVVTRMRSAPMAAGLAMMLVPVAWGADVPVLDRVPADAAIVVTVPSISGLVSAIDWTSKTFNIPEEEGPFTEIKAFLGTEGIDGQGSFALAILPGPDGLDLSGVEPPPMVMLLPTKDHAALVKAWGGDAAQPIAEVDPLDMGEPGYAKNLGGGWTAVAMTSEMLESFKGEGGNSAGHLKLLGPSGRAAIEKSSVSVFVNIAYVAPMVREGFAQFKEQAGMMMMMAPPEQVDATMGMLQAVVDGFLRDGQAVVLGGAFGQAGLDWRMAAQFKEGSVLGGYFAGGGNASRLLAGLPNQPFLAAMALDTSAPGIKALLKRTAEAGARVGGEMAAKPGLMDAILGQMDRIDGQAVLWGTTPSVVGGLFINAMAFVKTSDPAGYIASFKSSMGAMNGVNVEGLTYETSFEDGYKTIANQPAALWSMKMNIDENHPAAMQMSAMMSAFFGDSGGPAGYIIPAPGGVITTFSKNSKLVEDALATAGGGANLGQREDLRPIAEVLPANRFIEAYLGSKGIMETVFGAMAMMGAGGDLPVPENVPPVGLGASANAGGLLGHIHVPMGVITAGMETAKAMQGGDVGENQPDPR